MHTENYCNKRTRKQVVMTPEVKEKLKNQLYNNHWIADYNEEDPLVSLWLTDLVDLIEDYRNEIE